MNIFAHRGASGEFPENTLLAFEQAIIQNADGIEFDVQYHQKSGEFILLHDSYLTHNSSHTHYNDLSLSQLFQIQLPQQQRICTLSEALICIGHECQINIELKSSAQGDLLAIEMVALQKLLGTLLTQKVIAEKNIIISSFNHHSLVLSSALLPKIKTAALIAHCPLNYAQFCESLPVSFLNTSIDALNEEIVHSAQEKGLKVFVYTVDLPLDINRCLSLKVDGIFTNFPIKTSEIIKNQTINLSLKNNEK